MIDLRSDTVTQPTDEMRSAIANAVVGDDVYHDDPTVNELEATVADMLGKQDAMFVPTGTMSNQIAIRVQTDPGDSVIIEQGGHVGTHELGGPAMHSGVTLLRIPGEHGTFTADQLQALIPTPHPALPAHLFDPVTLVCLENTHNTAGGTIWPIDRLQAVSARAKDLGLARHLDGARLWNASVATGVPLDAYAAWFETVSVCFSKGLGAPIGSALVGDTELISKARRFKHLFGGGFRQAGMLAAGALYGIRNHMDRLADDHADARRFAEGLVDVDGIDIDLDSVQTNIVNYRVANPELVVDICADNGVATLVNGPGEIRAVFSLASAGAPIDELVATVAAAVRTSASRSGERG